MYPHAESFHKNLKQNKHISAYTSVCVRARSSSESHAEVWVQEDNWGQPVHHMLGLGVYVELLWPDLWWTQDRGAEPWSRQEDKQETTHIIETSKNNPETAWLVWLVVAILWMVGTKVGLVLCTSCLASNLHMHTARDGTHSSLNPPRVDQSWEGIGWYHTKWNRYLNGYHW